jgi:DNA repair protein RadC
MAFASARPCATIIPLPTAAATPVIQLRRHGRLPKAVSSLRAARTRATASYTARETRPTYADAHIVTQALAYIESCFHRPEFTITSPRDVADYLRARIGARDHEVFAVLFLDAQHCVLACEEMFRGQSIQIIVYPREVARRALQLNACAIIASHNHPSGNLTPSAADHDLTLTLRRTLELIDVRVLDHIIVSAPGAYSMEARRAL